MIFRPSKMLSKVRTGRKDLINLRSVGRIVLVFSLINFLVVYSQSDRNTSKSEFSICFVSDTQEPTIFERLFLKYNKNAYARKLILEKIVQDTSVAVFHLGDIVASGYFSNWKEIDTFVYKLNERGVNFYPIPGNHEYLPASELSISNFIKRYGKEKTLGYSKKFNNLGVIILNSNFDELSDEKKSKQMKTYRENLRNFEADSTIQFIIVACHHSPFTNSKIVSPSKEVLESFLPEFYASKKSKLFISGHAHAFEYFVSNGKDFLVIGGGGGLQQPLKTEKEARFFDKFNPALRKRMFHYLKIIVKPNKIKVKLEMLKESFNEFTTTDLFEHRVD